MQISFPVPFMRLGARATWTSDYDTYFGVEHSTGYDTTPAAIAWPATPRLFQRADMVERAGVSSSRSWMYGTLSLRAIPNYAAGSWGAAKPDDDLLARDGRGLRPHRREDVDVRGKHVAEKKGCHH